MNSPPPDRDRPADELSPAEEERVRRLLVEARAEEPMPAEVTERMEATLADLAHERDVHAGVPESERPAGPVTPLSSRRRRVVGGLVAAAVVIVVGVGIGQVVAGTSQPHEAATSNGADRSGATVGDDELSAEGDAGGHQERAEAPSADQPAPVAPSVRIRRVDEPVPVVRPQQLHDDAIRLRRDLVPGSGARPGTYQRAVVISPNGFKCSGNGWGVGAFVGVEYDGRLAMLAYREPTGKQQIAEVLQCGTGDLLRSTTIPAP